tara:strand:+ start:10429 stop:11103 length:675 start_codon:yes stop_codon:yes gene_type:complete
MDTYMNKNYGTQENPIRRIQDNLKRELISRCKDICEEGLETAPDLGKLRGASDYSDDEYTFITNIITNQQLSHNAVRLGCFLYIYENTGVEELVFDLSDFNKKFKDKNLADGTSDDFVYVISAKNSQPEMLWLPIKHLLKLLMDAGIMLNKPELIACLIELHEFYYITATEICYENSLEHYKATGEVKKVGSDSNLVHIHLTTSMQKKALTTKWLSYTKNRMYT